MKAGTTIRVRGEGGSEWDQDVPPLGSTQRELLDDSIAKGRVQVLNDPDAEAEEARPLPVGASQVAGELVSALDHFAQLSEDEQLEVLEVLEVTRPDLSDLGDSLTGLAHTEDGDTDAKRPNVRDGKPDWVTYAIAQGADPDDAAAMTKEQLVERYGKES